MKTLDPIFDQIVNAVIQQPWLSVQYLYDAIKSDNPDFVSLGSFYKYIAQLINIQILIKQEWKIGLHSFWLNQMEVLHQQLSDYQKVSQSLWDIESIRCWQPIVIYGENLDKLDFIRTDRFFQIAKQNPGEVHYHFNSHPAHIIGLTERETATLWLITSQQTQSFFVLWHSTPLDQYGANLLTKLGHRTICLESDLFWVNGHYINIFWNFIIECYFPEVITQFFEIFFTTVKSYDQLDLKTFSQWFQMKQNTRLTISYDEKRAQYLKKMIIWCFNKSH
jgi:hypothetical protein